jgi:hypothetical protein
MVIAVLVAIILG